MLSVVVTIDLSFRAIDIISKAFLLAKALNNESIELIFSHNNRSTLWDKCFIILLKPYSKIISSKISTSAVPNSAMRNIGVSNASHSTIALIDVDLWGDFNMLLAKAQLVESKKRPFVILPCIYLTSYGTQALRKNGTEVTNHCLNADRKYLQHLALPSSAIILLKDTFIKVGGFDEEFEGHGYEDFDFLMRVADFHDKLQPLTSTVDEPYKSPIFIKGFRLSLAKLCVTELLSRDILFHLHHKKNKKSYPLERARNKLLFENKISTLKAQPNEASSDSFFSYVETRAKDMRVDLEKLPILFHFNLDEHRFPKNMSQKFKFLFLG
ncbi:galactosyltransferase-related protein [Catenovulum sp. SX2]|uniref:galactosyltransferase-related protein n=1 Tax=Catenovulum sp. SX2 TaxID=3398614 RepID=UPI003F8690BA